MVECSKGHNRRQKRFFYLTESAIDENGFFEMQPVTPGQLGQEAPASRLITFILFFSDEGLGAGARQRAQQGREHSKAESTAALL